MTVDRHHCWVRQITIHALELTAVVVTVMMTVGLLEMRTSLSPVVEL